MDGRVFVLPIVKTRVTVPDTSADDKFAEKMWTVHTTWLAGVFEHVVIDDDMGHFVDGGINEEVAGCKPNRVSPR